MRPHSTIQFSLRAWLVLLAVVAICPVIIALAYAVRVSNDQISKGRELLLYERSTAMAALVAQRLDILATYVSGLASSDEVLRAELWDLQSSISSVFVAQKVKAIVEIVDLNDATVIFRAGADSAVAVMTPNARCARQTRAVPALSIKRTGAAGEEGSSAHVSRTIESGPLQGCTIRAVVPASVFGGMLRGKPWHSEWIASLIDEERRILARSMDQERFVGTPVTEPLMQMIVKHQTGVFRGISREGFPVLAYALPVPGWSQWYVAVGVPQRVVDAEVEASAFALALAAILAVLIGCATAIVLATLITKDVQGVAATAADSANAARFRVREIWDLGRALASSQESLHSASRRQQQVISDLNREVARRMEIERRLHQVQSRLLRAQEAERARIARELHDELGQELVTLRLRLQAMRTSGQSLDVQSELLDAEHLVSALVKKARSLALDLRPSQLDDLGLEAALRSLVRTATEPSSLSVKTDIENLLHRPGPQAETALFRVAQAAITNSVLHAHAAVLTITLTEDARGVELVVNDDGAGFDVSQELLPSGEHMGLPVMEERMRSVGGVLEVTSALGRGTKVRARVPFMAGDADE